jgi:hypothetical protein
MQNLDPMKQWCFHNIDCDDEGVTITESIMNQNATAVSDASFQDQYALQLGK